MSKKVFKVKELNLRTINITPEIRRNSQKYYAKALAEAFAANLPLRAEIDKMLESKNLSDDNKHLKQKQHTIRKSIVEMEKSLRTAKNADGTRMSKEQGRELAIKIRTERSSLLSVGNSTSEFYNNTAENYAENEQTLYYVFACTYNADTGKSLWPSFEDFKIESDNPNNNDLIRSVTREFFLNIGGIDVDYEKNFYEIQWLIRMGYMNDKLQLINENGKLIDNDGKLINSEGRFINEEGDLVDVYGNKVDEKGGLLVEDGW